LRNNERKLGTHEDSEGKGKGKVIPLQAWTVLEGSRSLRGSQILRQSTHEGGKVLSATHRPPLPSREIFLVLISVRV
jgi:hypothetical protein